MHVLSTCLIVCLVQVLRWVICCLTPSDDIICTPAVILIHVPRKVSGARVHVCHVVRWLRIREEKESQGTNAGKKAREGRDTGTTICCAGPSCQRANGKKKCCKQQQQKSHEQRRHTYAVTQSQMRERKTLATNDLHTSKRGHRGKQAEMSEEQREDRAESAQEANTVAPSGHTDKNSTRSCGQ